MADFEARIVYYELKRTSNDPRTENQGARVYRQGSADEIGAVMASEFEQLDEVERNGVKIIRYKLKKEEPAWEGSSEGRAFEVSGL